MAGRLKERGGVPPNMFKPGRVGGTPTHLEKAPTLIERRYKNLLNNELKQINADRTRQARAMRDFLLSIPTG
jgi:hypothetical protein